MLTEFNKVKSGVTFTKAAQKQDLQSGDTIPEALGKLAKYMDVTDDALSNIQPILTFDSEPEYESLNPVTSGGLYDYIELQSPTYINTFSTESDLYSYSGNLTNNDYAFVGTGSGATYYMNVYQYKSEVIRDTIEDIKTTPSGSNILKTLNEPALPTGNIQYKLDCYVTAVNNQSYGTSPVITVIFSDNTTTQITVPNANKTHIVKTYSKTIKAVQFMNSGQASDGYTDFEDIQILTTAGWNKLSYRLYNPTWDANQLSAINSGITSTKVTNYDNHIANKSNPHEVTKSQVGLGNVGNFKAVSTEASQGLTSTEQSNARTNINAQESLSFNGTYNASTNKVATESTVTDAINALDVSSQGGAGKYISEISETNGKISATPTTMDTSLSNSSTNSNCPTSKTVYDDQQRQDAALAEVENKGAKNDFDLNTSFPSAIKYHATASKSNGTVSITSTGNYGRCAIPYNFKSGTSVFSCTVSSFAQAGGTSTVRFAQNSDGTSKIAEPITISGNGKYNAEIAVSSDTAGYIILYINGSGDNYANSANFSDLMICTKAEWDISHEYVPYGKTNAELTNENKSQQSEIDYAVNTGVKNLLPMTHTSGSITRYGVTCTWDLSSGTMTLNGTHSSGDSAAIFELYDGSAGDTTILPAGSYVLTGCPAGGSTSSYRAALSQIAGAVDVGNGATFELSEPHYAAYRILISGNVTFNNMVFKPMIRSAEITDPTYEPYARSNPALTAEMDYVVNAGAKNIFDIQAAATAQRTTTVLNPDGGITISCNAALWATRNVIAEIPAGDYICSLFVDAVTIGGGTFAFFVNQSNDKSTWTELARQTQITSTGRINKHISVSQKYLRISTNINNSDTSATNSATIRLMIRPASITDPTFQPYADTNPVLTQEMNWNVNQGVKNLIKLSPNTYTSGNVVVELNNDGTVSVSLSSGSTANATFSRAIKTITDLRGMDLILNGCPSGGNYSSGYALYISDDSVTQEKDEGNGVLVPKNTTVTTSYLALIVRSGTEISGTLTFKPMIRPASITDPTFQPYALPNPTLTPAAIKAVDEGAKNICNWSASTSTISGVTFTINSDKTISTSGTATARSQKPLTFTVPSTLKAGRYVLSGCPAGGAQSGRIYYCLYIWDNTANGRVCSNDTGDAIEFDWAPDASHSYTIAVDVRSGTNASDLIFRPMICTAADWAVSQKFMPYALPNPILTPAAIKAVDDGAKNLVNAPSGSGVRFINIPIVLQPSDYYVLFQNITSTDTDASTCQFGAFANDDSQASNYPQLKRGDNTGAMFTVRKQTSYVRLYAANDFAKGAGDTITFTGCMICTAADWAVSQKFVPYAPTNRELYETCETKVTMQQAYGDAILIPANSDLNTYTTPGIYYIVVANVPTIINTPYTSTGFRLVVEKNTPSGGAVFQTIYPTSSVHLEFFRRVYEGGSWSSWYKFEGTEVTS